MNLSLDFDVGTVIFSVLGSRQVEPYERVFRASLSLSALYKAYCSAKQEDETSYDRINLVPVGTIVKGGQTTSIDLFDIACINRILNRCNLDCRSANGLVMTGYNGDPDGASRFSGMVDIRESRGLKDNRSVRI